MNTHARNPSFKLTMVSVYYHYRRYTTFMHLPVDPDGKVRAPNYNDIFAAFGVYPPRGSTISIG